MKNCSHYLSIGYTLEQIPDNVVDHIYLTCMEILFPILVKACKISMLVAALSVVYHNIDTESNHTHRHPLRILIPFASILYRSVYLNDRLRPHIGNAYHPFVTRSVQ